MPSVPFYSLDYMHQQIAGEVGPAFQSVYQRNQFVLGQEVAAFEKEYAAYCGTKYCVGLANGLDALYVSLKLLGLSEGDEVIVPAHTYIATWLAISRTGATIIPIDVNPDTMLLDIDGVRRAISKKTKALLPVHLYGNSCDMAELMSLAEQYKLKVIEDNAQAHGSRSGGKMMGSFGHCNATSFYPSKNLGALGDGGAVTTNDEQIYNEALAFRNYGSTKRFENEIQGINSRLDELQAAVLRIKLKHLNSWNDARRRVADWYLERLSQIADIHLPINNSSSVFHLFVVRTRERDKLQAHLKSKGIETLVHYPTPPHLQKAYSNLGFVKGDFPVSESIASTALSLPIWPGINESQVAFVCDTIKKFHH